MGVDHNKVDTTPCVKLYNSSASQHISPYKADFSSYTTLSQPCYLNATNQNRFPAIGMGTLVICAPNNANKSELILHNVLHTPSIGYTLVSLEALNEEGYTSHITSGCLRITSPHREQVADITHMHHLYQVKHSPEFAHIAKLMSSMELHRRLGHISVISACKLVQSGAVKGIKLDPNAPETDCEACIFARATCLPIYKLCISVLAQSFGDKIHSNIWGPAPVTTLKGA